MGVARCRSAASPAADLDSVETKTRSSMSIPERSRRFASGARLDNALNPRLEEGGRSTGGKRVLCASTDPPRAVLSSRFEKSHPSILEPASHCLFPKTVRR